MGTRSGDVDPALHLHLTQATGQSLDDVNTMLNKKSGLQGLCGDSDMRAIQERVDKGDKDAEVALGVFIKVRARLPPHCRTHCGALALMQTTCTSRGV